MGAAKIIHSIGSIGILENVLIKVRQSIISVDFVVLNIEKDIKMPIILGKTFLPTAQTLIDEKNGKFIFQFNGEKLEFNFINKNRDK